MPDQHVNAWELRLDLAIRGWHTELRMTRMGVGNCDPNITSFGVWATRKYWQGRHADICLHDHDTVDLNAKDAIQKMMRCLENVHEACLRAAIDFPDEIPCLKDRNADGSLGLVVNTWEMQHARAPCDDLIPTEHLPDDAKGHGDGNCHMVALRAAAVAGLHVEDSLNPYFGRSRYAGDCKDRDWGYKLRLAIRKIDDVTVTFRPHEFTTHLLHESAITSLITSSSSAILVLFRDFAPGGCRDGMTSNGLPPGFQLLQEFIAERDAKSDEMAP